MKSILFAFSFTALILSACSKSGTDDNGGSGSANIVPSSSVPQATISSFSSEFSGATGVEWQRNSSSSFTVQFNHSSQRHDAGYDDNGHRSSHSIICIDGTVPEIVLQAFRQGFPTDNVYEWKLRNDGTWKAHFMRGAVKFEATYTAAGALVKFERA
ncbi:MAG TPA: hypothetical protein VGO58_08170 [Chitinophagaceae bacterium]|jgi:hypothetical protein|nr:hypothetical protein [Chitinophagaceae bacterium]